LPSEEIGNCFGYRWPGAAARVGRTDKTEKVLLVDLVTFQREFGIQYRTVAGVELLEDIENISLLVARYLAPLDHCLFDPWFPEELEQVVVIEKTFQLPDDTDKFFPEPGRNLDADADMDAKNTSCFQQFLCHFPVNMVVVDYGQFADTLDPGIHEQVGGGFSALGVGVVDMVVKGELIPRLRHFQEMIFFQFGPDQARFTGAGHTKVMGELQLLQLVSLMADQFFHDLHQDPGRVPGEKGRGGAEYLIVEAAQGTDAIFGFACFQGTQQAGNGISDSQAAWSGHLLDSVGVHVWRHERAQGLGAGIPSEDVVDNAE